MDADLAPPGLDWADDFDTCNRERHAPALTTLREAEADGLEEGRRAGLTGADELRDLLDELAEEVALARWSGEAHDAASHAAAMRGVPMRYRDVWERAYVLGAERLHVEIALAHRCNQVLDEELAP